jgi:hypothetical protein
VQQYPQVIPIRPKLSADLILVLLLQEKGTEDLSVSSRQQAENRPDTLLSLPGNY